MEQSGAADGPPASPAYPIESVDRALRVLAMFTRQRSVRLADASAGLGVARRADLDADLADVRERGYATNVGESEMDLVAIAAAIRPQHGRATGSVGLSIPTSRFSTDALDRIAGMVCATAGDIAQQLST